MERSKMGEEGERKEGESEVTEGEKGKERVMMDTPERSKNQIATPVSRFEDSPVFNFLNNLSPIQPVKSVHISQTFNALGFASLPSIFTSPHVTSLRESRFLRSYQLVDPSRPEFSSDNGKKNDTDEGIMDVANKSDEQQENFDAGNCLHEACVEPSYEGSKLAVQLAETLNYDCSSPISSPKTYCASGSNFVSEFDATGEVLIPFAQTVSEKGLLENEAVVPEASETDQSRDARGCNLDCFISDSAGLLIFDSPNNVDTSKKSLGPASALCSNIADDLHNMQAYGSVEQGEGNEVDNPSTQPGEGSCPREFAEIQDAFAGSSLNNNYMGGGLDQKTGSKPVSHLYRGMRRRCLVFEMVGARRKHLDGNLSSSSPIVAQSDGSSISNDKQLVPVKPGNDSSRCIIPGIGLHLNALAAAPKDHNVVKHDAAVFGRLIIAPGPTANFYSLSAGQEPVNPSLATSMETGMDPVENGVPVLEDDSQASVHMDNEELNQSSPKKKRHRLEHAGESEACKRCNCKKSKCLKLYCECFAAGVYCVEPCSCQECFNKPIHEDTVLATRKQIESRNPLAFAPKVIRSSDSMAEAGDDSSKTPASARHKRGCNCKKSGCLKKYCECYQGGVGCSVNCRCEGCKNTFGIKDGSAFIGTEAEFQEDEIDALEKGVNDRASQKMAIQCDMEQNPDSVPPSTPQIGRPSVQLPFSSKKKPPRSSLPFIGSSSLYASQGLGKANFLPPQAKFDNHFETIQEDEMPEILQGNGSPISSIKSASPNSKRVSPPHYNSGIPTGRRSSRKLILQSIPAFPSLTPKH